MKISGWLVDLGPYPGSGMIHAWSGTRDVVVNGTTYTAVGGIVAINGVDIRTGQQDSRVQIQLQIPNNAIRAQLLQDPGYVEVLIRWVEHSENMTDLTILPKSYRGVLSDARIVDDLYTIEVETRKGDIDRGRVKYISDESQRADYPNDRAFEFQRQFAQGFEIRWPP